ncbi:hypothetical protein MSG28_001871 [Choristoneura fumiferana]|uniref:Uncharacterized protein n=1 Tax=Choristoneura fumiferana TaxID=7141 RepID=A0ACC0JTA6_CHOFU|nr:hypothetical protein MSG28_001871 [Choristoneura fumiferana]
MSPLARSLLALAAAALLHSACAAPKKVGDSQCTTVMHGSILGMENKLPTVRIPAGVQDASVDVPNTCAKAVVGERVIVCDDVPPTVYVPELPLISPVVVHRNGNYFSRPAEVRVTLWCQIA